MRRFPRLRRTLALVVSLACSAGVPAAVTAADRAPVEINVLVPETGAGAFLGKSYEEALTALQATVNETGGIHGRPLKFVTADSQTSAQVGLQIVNALLAKHVPLFIDGGPSPVCSASVPLVQTNGPVDYCLSPAIAPAPRGYVFSANASIDDLASVAVRYLRNRGIRRLGMITSTDTTGQAYDRAIAAAMNRSENRGMELVASEHFNGTDLSVSAQLARIKAANPGVLMVWSTGTPLGTVLRSLKDAGYDIPVLSANSNMTYAQMEAYRGVLPRDFWFTSVRGMLPEQTRKGPLREAQMLYVGAFRKEHVRPDIGHNLVWDPAMLLIDALRSVGPDATAQQLHAWVLGQHSWIGVNGVYDFADGSQRGLSESAIVVARWDPERQTWLQLSAPRGALR